MKFEIKNRWTGEVQFTADIDADEGTRTSVKLGLAVKWGIKSGADLRDAYLRGADLRGAYLGGADLRGADLRGAYLGGAYLGGAYLGGADLRDAYLGGADLRDAYLRGADLRGAYLGGADLRGADLRGAYLGGADLRGADLRGAYLRCLGNMAEIKTLQFDKWMIGYTHETLQIGCQRHAIEKWRKWDTPAGRKWIDAMDSAALEWADKYLALVLSIIDASPATPTGEEAAA